MRNRRDPGNWAHELCHWVNSLLRVDGYNSFYVLGGRYLTLPEPKVTIEQVADNVPADQRGKGYKLYLVTMRRYWNNQPLYILDEATAYTTGLAHHVELGQKDNSRMMSANEFVVYSRVLLETVKRLVPSYVDMPDLEEYINWNAGRVASLTRCHNGERLVKPPVTPEIKPAVKPTVKPDDFKLY
jgi:hypothetical protein